MMQADCELSKAKTAESLIELKKLVDQTLYSMIPLMILYLAIGALSNSMTILAVAFDYGLSLIVQLFAYKSIRTIIKSDLFKFPYGTGKLENFSAIVYGALAIPVALFIIYSSITRFILPPAIAIGIAQIPLIPNLVRSLYLFEKARRLNRVSDSPMVKSYYVNFKVTAIVNTSILASLSVVFVLASLGQSWIALIVDPAVSVILGIYMLLCGASLTIGNFKVLIDFPLPEADQLKIMAVLTREYSSYENIGNIYTRFSGKTRFVEVELYFKKERSLAEIAALKQEIENQLREHFNDLRFVLIPLREPEPSVQFQTAIANNSTR
jgi:cation diffusion facilitator family transporter